MRLGRSTCPSSLAMLTHCAVLRTCRGALLHCSLGYVMSPFACDELIALDESLAWDAIEEHLDALAEAALEDLA